MDLISTGSPDVVSYYDRMENLHPNELYGILFLKQKVFDAMERLDGWCSREKASILIDMIVETKPQVVVEVGVFGGKSLIPMAFALQRNQKGKIYGIDPWDAEISLEEMDDINAGWWGTVDHEAIYQTLLGHITNFGLNKQIELLRTTSMQAEILEEIDLIHIDGNHSDKTSYEDVTKWLPQVKKGGIIILDDIDWTTTSRAKTYLDEHCNKIAEIRGVNLWGIWVK